MKRLLSLMMVLVLVLSMSISAFATEPTTPPEPAPGTITIKNATIGQTYRLFKIFNATQAVDAEGKPVLDTNGKPIVSYTIEKSDKFFEAMFGENGTADTCFNYDAETNVVTLKSGVADGTLIAYLTELIAEHVDAGEKLKPIDEKKAESATVIFENLETGYYVIDRGTTSTITIDSNTPYVTVIDKNQQPGTEFDKVIVDAEGNPVENNSANVGDMIDWKIYFTATNYAGKELVEYYSVRDSKDSSLWVEFNDIEVSINYIDDDGKSKTEKLEKGYYHCATSDLDTNEWEYLGTGWGEIDPNNKPNPNDAQWYLIHYGFDDFEIVIPWLENHEFEGKMDETLGYTLKFPEDAQGAITATSRYAPTVTVYVSYPAAVGPDASLEENGTVGNSAYLKWETVSGSHGPEDPQTTETKVYNMGISKIANDGGSNRPATPLSGAEFELYREQDAEGELHDPVYVIPTGVDGVYVLDDVFNNTSGTNRVTSRERYNGAWDSYINDEKAKVVKKVVDGETITATVRCDMTTPPGGKIVILGLKAGTYYLKETKAPEGYNKLPDATVVTVGSGNNTGTYAVGNAQYSVYYTEVINNQGVELPSTGGEGTTMMITVGSIVAMVFAVLLITHKKMTVYQD